MRIRNREYRLARLVAIIAFVIFLAVALVAGSVLFQMAATDTTAITIYMDKFGEWQLELAAYLFGIAALPVLIYELDRLVLLEQSR